jgi:two-component system nitrogen regulation response regulator NtrX
MPALRHRMDDLPLLARSFVDTFSRQNALPRKELLPAALEAMMRYGWPGNVRELKNVCERLVILGGDPITLEDLPREMAPEGAGHVSAAVAAVGIPDALQRAENRTLREFRDEAERYLVEKKLRELEWNITRAAAALGLERTNLHKKIRQLGLTRPGHLPASAEPVEPEDPAGDIDRGS